jgi:outer membrane receptor protein involved in Fe transport
MNKTVASLVTSACLVVFCTCIAAGQAATGRIEGRVVHQDGSGAGGVSVVLNEASITTISDRTGAFAFGNVLPGTYSVTLLLGDQSTEIPGVSVAAGATTTVHKTIDWEVGFTESLIVVAPSRRLERTVDAPASVTRVSEADIKEKAAHGQLPKLLEHTPGAELTQSGVYDFNFNTRGFNSSLTRRVSTIIDGRDPSIPFLGAEEWAALSFPLDDMASLEFVRGPSAALYGANASSGVLDITTSDPRVSPGGMVRLTFGQLKTVNLDGRWAGALGHEWYAKVVGGLRSSGDFTVSRNGVAEYSVPCPAGRTGDCLPQERVPLARLADDQILFGGARVDKYFVGGRKLTVEGGLSHVAGPAFQTGIGRVQVIDAKRPWTRIALSSDRVNVFASYTGRKAPEQLSLGPGTNISLDERRLQVEGQTKWSLGADKVRLVAGASARTERIDSVDRNRGVQTLLFEPVGSNQRAMFGQADWNVTKQLKLVAAGRGDWSSLHDFQFSPKASVVYAVVPDHSVRFTYNGAFQVPNYSELFVQADAAPPVNLGALNAICRQFDIDCRFGPTRILAVGNKDLKVEHIRTSEVGYKGILGRRALLTLDYHRSQASDFVTDLLPQLGTALGRINPRYGPWKPPSGLPDAAATAIRALAPPTLSNNLDGSNILAVVSYANFGDVSTQGVDAGVDYSFRPGWRFAFAYSWFDFKVEKQLPGFDALLLPNAPTHSLSTRVGYDRKRLGAGFSLRWVDGFRWAVGSFQGDVKSYAPADVTAHYELNSQVTVGLNIANLFDDRHWESFGGDILRRRALASVKYGW